MRLPAVWIEQSGRMGAREKRRGTVRVPLAIGLFTEGAITLAKATRMAGLTRYEFARLLKRRGLSAYEYTEAMHREKSGVRDFGLHELPVNSDRVTDAINPAQHHPRRLHLLQSRGLRLGWAVAGAPPEAAGLAVCTDQESFDVGVPSLINMENAVAASRHTLLVLTPAYVQSQWTRYGRCWLRPRTPAACFNARCLCCASPASHRRPSASSPTLI